MKSTQELEREHEETRALLNRTLDELRSRVTPGQVLDELVDYARGTNGGLLIRNLGQRVVENPLPLALIGTGLAWIMASDARTRGSRRRFDTSDLRGAADRTAGAADDLADSTRATARRVSESTTSAARDMADSVRSSVRGAGSTLADVGSSVRDTTARSADAASSAIDNMRDAASRSADAASSAIDEARSAAGSAYRRAARATRRATSAIGDSSVAVARTVQDRSMDFVDFCREQPLVVAGLGLALGAALGAALPRTEAEDRLVGETSDDVKDRMQRVAGKVKESATSAYQQVAEEALASEGSRPRHTSSAETAESGARRAPSSDDEGMTSSRDEGVPRPMTSSADPKMLRSGDECSDVRSEGERR